MREVKAIVMGSSAGGLKALTAILSALPPEFEFPIAIVQHLSPDSTSTLAAILSELTRFTVKEAEDKEPFLKGLAYLAPPNYHLLIERDSTLALSVDDKECYSRPSIDVLFESASDAYGADIVGVILTGASSDGSLGLKKIQDGGGIAIVQEPEGAESQTMPKAAIDKLRPDHILPLDKIGPFLGSLADTLRTGAKV